MHVIYDVSHNIAKMEQHYIDGKLKHLLVHRKVFKILSISYTRVFGIITIIILQTSITHF